MAAPRPWKVTPHQPLAQLDDNLWVVEGRVPGAPLPRRMSVVRLSDGTLALHDSFAVDDATLAAIRALGTPRLQLIAHHQHMIEAPAVREKLGLRSYCPKGCADKVRARMPIDGTFDELPKDAALELRAADGLKTDEHWLVTKSAAGRKTLVTADTVFSMREGPFMMRLAGVVNAEPKVAPLIFRLFALADKKRFKASFAKLLDDHADLARVVPCHGDVLESDVVNVLRSAIARA